MVGFFSILVMLASLLVIVAVTAQEPKTQGMGSLSGQETNVFGKSAHKSKDELLDKFVIAGGIVLFIGCLTLTAIK